MLTSYDSALLRKQKIRGLRFQLSMKYLIVSTQEELGNKAFRASCCSEASITQALHISLSPERKSLPEHMEPS